MLLVGNPVFSSKNYIIFSTKGGRGLIERGGGLNKYLHLQGALIIEGGLICTLQFLHPVILSFSPPSQLRGGVPKLEEYGMQKFVAKKTGVCKNEVLLS